MKLPVGNVVNSTHQGSSGSSTEGQIDVKAAIFPTQFGRVVSYLKQKRVDKRITHHTHDRLELQPPGDDSAQTGT